MTHSVNDFKETFLHSGIYQVLMNSRKGTNANEETGNGERETDGKMVNKREGGKEGGKRGRENYHHCDE